MNILHVFSQDNLPVTTSFIKFVNTNFDKSVHSFIIIGDADKSSSNTIPVENNIKYCSNKIIQQNKLYKRMLESDKVFFHSSLGAKYQLLAIMFPHLMNKIYWISWGADMYEIGDKGKWVKKYLKKYISLIFAHNVKNFVGIFPPDIQYFNDHLNIKARTFYASYPLMLYSNVFSKKISSKSLETKLKNNECVNIQIGHSSFPVLNHIEVLEQLSKFKNENIKIFLPLNYGEMNYGDVVQQKALEIFGDKVICMRERMSQDEYMQYLSTIDIAIFNTTRQIGLGNISFMLFLEKKIYMPRGTIMYDFYKSEDIEIWDYNEISQFNFDQFVESLKYKNGREYIFSKALNLDYKINLWNKIFESSVKHMK